MAVSILTIILPPKVYIENECLLKQEIGTLNTTGRFKPCNNCLIITTATIRCGGDVSACMSGNWYMMNPEKRVYFFSDEHELAEHLQTNKIVTITWQKEKGEWSIKGVTHP